MVTFNPYDPRAAFLLGMGGGMLENAGWSTMPTSLGQSLGAGLRSGQRSMSNAVAMKRLQDQAKLEEGMQKLQKAKLKREAQLAAQVEEMIAGLPPEQQVYARLNPKKFVETQMSGGGMFEGSGLSNQAFNLYENVLHRLNTGQPVSDREYNRAQLAYDELSKPEVRIDQQSGEEIWIRRNLAPLPAREGTAPPPPSVAQAAIGETPAEEDIGGTTVTRRKTGKTKFPKDQTDAAGFAYRMQNTASKIDQLTGGGVEFPAFTAKLRDMNVPGTNVILNPQERQMLVAAREFTRAALRRESGAVIGAEEIVETIQTYFPQPFDDPETVAYKDQLRADLVETNIQSSQGAYEQLYGEKGGGTGGTGETGVTPVTGTPDTQEAATATPQGVKRPKTLAEAQKYPSGTQFVWQGKVYTRN